MKKSKKGATLVMAMPLALATLTVGAPTMQALPLAQGICQTTQSRISKAQKLNGTTVEVIYTDGKRLTIDFYGENIFRLFRDDNGGIVCEGCRLHFSCAVKVTYFYTTRSKTPAFYFLPSSTPCARSVKTTC